MTSSHTHQPAVNQLTFSFDPISPFAYLAFMQLPQALRGLSYSVTYRPVLFAGLLKHYGQLGPAEIAPKRDWTFRYISYLAHSMQVPLIMPPAHPFNPLPYLRALIASDKTGRGLPNRHACDVILSHLWNNQPMDTMTQSNIPMTVYAESLGITEAQINDEAVKLKLREHTDAAIQEGCFGVPTIRVDDKSFWGLDALPMLSAYLQGDDAWFASDQWQSAATLPQGVQRQR